MRPDRVRAVADPGSGPGALSPPTKATRKSPRNAAHPGRPSRVLRQTDRPDSRARLMKAAERLFADKGVGAVSIRDIAAAAGVNSALIAYYFGSKEELFVAVYRAVVDPINAERHRRFDALDALSRPPTIEEVLEAWMRPALVDYVDAEHARFAKLALAVTFYDQAVSGRLAADIFEAVNDRALDFLQQSLPDVPRATLVWRLYFLIGAVMMAARQRNRGMDILSRGQCNPDSTEEVYRELLTFAAAGFRALAEPA
jgi:AcrR family transcriptional regulator